jgi:hypothetical protein
VQRRLKVIRTVTCSYETTWPEEYPGMSWEEVLEYENGLDMAEVLEAIHGSDNLTKTCAIEVADDELEAKLAPKESKDG